MTVRLIGSWGNRTEDLVSCAARLQRSIDLMPQEPDVYQSWGVWQSTDAKSAYNVLVPVDVDDVEAVKNAIAVNTERVNGGPKTTPGQHIEFVREGVSSPTSVGEHFYQYVVRAGFTDTPAPFNHILFQLKDGADASVLTRYLSALVIAWGPDNIAVLDRKAQRAQGHKPPEVAVGWMTYLRADVPLDVDALGDEISVANADGGVYITVPGTPDDPSIDHIRRVRAALGYSG